MHQPIAEREIPYDQYASIMRYSQHQQQVGNSEQIYSTCRVASRIANTVDGSHHVAQSQNAIDTVDGLRCLEPTTGATAAAQELRQFSREPTVLNFDQLSTYDVSGTQRQQPQENGVGGAKKPSALKSSSLTIKGSSNILPVGMSAGFDSNTLKRMLQTLPEATSPIALDRRHQFDDDEIDDDDIVGDNDDVNPDAESQSDLAAAIISDLRRTSPPPTVASEVLPDSPPPPLPIDDITGDVVLTAETISGILRPLLMSAATSPQSDDGVKNGDPSIPTDGGAENTRSISVTTVEQRTTNTLDDKTTNKMTSLNDRNPLNEFAAKSVEGDVDVTASDHDHQLQQSQLIEAPVAFGESYV